MTNKVDFKQIEMIIRVAKRLDAKGLVNAYEGNFSIKKDGLLYITPTGKVKDWYTPDMICVFDENDNQVWGDLAPTSEYEMHKALYGMRDNIGGVVHAHPPVLTTYALCAKPVETKAYAEFIVDHKEVPVCPFGMLGTIDIVAGAKDILDKGRNGMLLANHGALTVGKTLEEAMNRMESLEKAAKMIMLSQFVGKTADFDEELFQGMFNYVYEH